MQSAVKFLVSTIFRAQGCQANKPIRTIDGVIEVKVKLFFFKAQSFLYQQIRIMVGSLLEVGLKNKILIDKRINRSKDRSLAGPTVPSKGLILKEISY